MRSPPPHVSTAKPSVQPVHAIRIWQTRNTQGRLVIFQSGLYNTLMKQKIALPGRSLPVFAIMTIVAIIPDPGCDQKSAAPTASSRPNVLLVTFDTTRADYLSCYGHPGNTTPTIDAIAREGIRFANCFTPAPITLPAHATIMTGLDRKSVV